MGESSRHTPERQGSSEFKASAEQKHASEHETKHETEQRNYEHERNQALEHARHQARETAKPAETLQVESEEKNSSQGQVNRELKGLALQRVLTRTRKRLNPADKAISRLIHQPVVDAISSGAEKTIARPTGFLFGSIIAFLGSLYLLYSARHYGFRYNFLIIVMLFAAGYVIGVCIEVIPKAFRRVRSK